MRLKKLDKLASLSSLSVTEYLCHAFVCLQLNIQADLP